MKSRVAHFKVNIFFLSLLVIGFCVFGGRPLQAQFIVHSSAMVNGEILNGHWPGYDFTFIVNQGWGGRYTVIPRVLFAESALEQEGNQVSTYNVEGDFRMPMILRTLDYRSFANTSDKGPFDFLTGYTAFGVANVKMEVKKELYSPQSSSLVHQSLKEEVEVPVQSFAFGFYGGEKFMVIDARLLYLRGTISSSDLIDEDVKFNHWMLIFSLGVGF